MIFIGGFLQIGKFFVDNKIKTLKKQEVILKEQKINEQVDSLKTNLSSSKKELNELREKSKQVDSLKINLSENKKELSKLKEKTKYVNPYTQPIESGKATVYIKIRTQEKFNNSFMDRGGIVVFAKGNEEILILSDNKCTGKSINNEEVVFQGVFELNANHRNIGKNLTFLKEAEYIQVKFHPLEKNYEIIEGKVVCVFNGNARLEFKIEKQMMNFQSAFIKNLNTIFDKKLK